MGNIQIAGALVDLSVVFLKNVNTTGRGEKLLLSLLEMP